MPQLLIELLSEEIPARMQLQAARDFERLARANLTASGLTFERIQGYVGPRRLTLLVDGLPVETAAVTEEIKGPREGAPPQALEGFLRKVGLTQDVLTIENGVYMARIEKPGVKTADVLHDMLYEVIAAFPWPKSMRSGTSNFRWVRPLKRILFIFDGQVVPFFLEGIQASNLTEGHRFNGSDHEPFEVKDFEDYCKKLTFHFVVLDHAERRKWILDVANQQCKMDKQLELVLDEGLADEVAGLCEDPVPLIGDMDPKFLSLPPEVIRTSMRTHQKYFAVRDPQTGKLAPHFVVVANTRTIDNGNEVKRGNAKVLSARLSDAVFFWNEDNRAGNFDAWLEKLKGTTFHLKLGTMAERVERISALAGHIAEAIGADVELTKKAARLAKADLASHMVMEFPELQGVMGGYYADALKLEPEVADAIREHYKPQGPGDTLPASKVSAAVALADKIDTLVGFFAIDEKPTGSKDPYALRRSTLGILRILREQRARINLLPLFNELFYIWARNQLSKAVEVLGGLTLDEFEKLSPDSQETILDSRQELREVLAANPKAGSGNSPNSMALLDFFTDRLKVQLREEGRPLDVIEAVLALKDDDVVRVINRIEALEAVKASDQGENLVAVHKRAANILAAAKWDRPAGDLLTASDIPEVESALIGQLSDTKRSVADHLRIENYRGALLSIAALRQNVDAFLDGVLVNDEDEAVRARRLNLLANVCALSEGLADLSKLA